jgi:hypothetical protein
LVAVGAAACSSSGTAVLVTVDATTAIDDLARLHATATAGTQTRELDVPLKVTTIPPAHSFGIDVPESLHGQLGVRVEGFDSHGTSIGSGEGSVTLASGHHAELAITIVSTIVTQDLATPDLALADLTPVSDLANVATGAVGVLGQPCTTLGDLACSGNAKKLPLVCGSGLTWQANGTCNGMQNCDSTPGPNQGTCAPIVPLCAGSQPGDIVCNGLVRTRCGPDLVNTSDVETCQYICKAGACTGLCTPTKLQCMGNTPQTCDADGQWQGTTACTNQACVMGMCQGVCAPAAQRCSGKVPQTCDGNGAWQGTTPCSGGFCNGAGVCGVCASGSKQCMSNTPQQCDATGQWQGSTACVNQTCVSGLCSGTCTAGAKQCSANTPQTCSGGQWMGSTACSNQTCINGVCMGVCASGAQSCNGSVPQSCTVNGQWMQGTACPGGYCNGAGICGVCAQGTTRCMGLSAQYCDGTGQWYTANNCQYVCSNGYCSGQCTPGSTNGCANNAPAYCDTNGNWQQNGSPCCTSCNNGACDVAQCGYSVCQRVPGNDSICTSTLTGVAYYWSCQNVGSCQTTGPTVPVSVFQMQSQPHGARQNAWPAGDWCESFDISCN